MCFYLFPLVPPGAGSALTNYNAYIWESLPAGTTVAQHDVNFDFDGDGVSNFNEWMALTNPADPTSYLHIKDFSYADASKSLSVAFPTVNGVHYSVQYTTSLASRITWQSLSSVFIGDGTPKTFL